MAVIAPLFVRVLLPEQRQRPNALHNIELPAVRGEFIVNRQTNGGGQGRGALFQRLTPVYPQIKAAGTITRQGRGRTDRQQPFGFLKVRESRLQFSHPQQVIMSTFLLAGRERIRCFPGSAESIQDPAEVPIPGLVLNINAKTMAVAVEFSTDDGFDSGLGRGLGKFHRSVQVVTVSQSDGWELMPPGNIDNSLDRKRGVQERIVAVNIQRNVSSPACGRRELYAACGARRASRKRGLLALTIPGAEGKIVTA